MTAPKPPAADPPPELLVEVTNPRGRLRVERRHYQRVRYYWIQRFDLGPDGVERPGRALSLKAREVPAVIGALINEQRATGTDPEPKPEPGGATPDWLVKYRQKQDRKREPTR